MQWASEKLPKEFLYSIVDDDMFVHIGWVQEYVSDVQNTMKVKQWPGFPILCMYGRRSGLSPIRVKANKYYCSYEDYPWPFWPDFCLGGMYTTNVDNVRNLWVASLSEPLVRLEDVWITGILRKKLGIPKEYLISVQPAAALHLESSFSKKQKLGSVLGMWKKLEPLLRQYQRCTCN